MNQDEQKTVTKDKQTNEFAGKVDLEQPEDLIQRDRSFKVEPPRAPKAPATLQFFAVYRKDNSALVLPSFFNDRYMTSEEVGRLKLVEALSGNIMIPSEPKPWSEITEDSDHLFLLIQSRSDWGQILDHKTNLLKVKQIFELVLAMQESLNNLTFRKDLILEKFKPAKESFEVKTKPALPKENRSEESGQGDQGIVPGQNWNV